MGKHLFAAIAVLFCWTHASAQLEPGKFYTGILSENRFGYFNNSYGFKSGLHYALDKYSSIGVNFNYSRSGNYQVHYLDNARAYNVQVGAGISYNYFRYFKNSKKLGWYANANLDLNRFKSFDIKYSGETVLNGQFNQVALSVKPGIYYTPSKNVMIFANFGGVSLNRSNGQFSGDFNFASQFNIGVLINFDVFWKRK